VAALAVGRAGRSTIVRTAMVLRHLFAAAVLPFTVAVVVPVWLARGYAARFGASYAEYRRHVPRFLPRPRPWSPSQ